MFTAELLEGWLKEYGTNSADVELAKPWLPSIARMLNAYGQALDVSRNDIDVKSMLQKLGFALRTGTSMSAAELKQKIVQWLKEEYVDPPASINAFSLDAANNALSASALEQSTDLHQLAAPSERAEIARLRSEKTKVNGRKLAEAAIALLHRIHWLERGQEAFLGISTDTHPKSGRGVNQFALWLQGMELDSLPQVRMNCWESVFYTACKANLISRGAGPVRRCQQSGTSRRRRGQPPRPGAQQPDSGPPPKVQIGLRDLSHHDVPPPEGT